MNQATPVCVWPVGAELGEGPVWQTRENAVYFVDIKGRNIHCFSNATREMRTWRTPNQPGFIAPLADGAFICGMPDGLHRFEASSNRFSFLKAIEPHLPCNRLNDGFVDATGHLWFGSMDDSEIQATGSLYRVDGDGRVSVKDSGYVIANGPALSPDGATLYHGDTLRRVVYAFDVAADGKLSRKRPFTTISGEGYPDGMAVDSDGYVWIAIFGGARIERFAPDGTLVDQVQFPCSNVTKLAFGGGDLCTVYVTTAWKGLPSKERDRQPLAGGLFSFRSPTPGQPPVQCTVGF